MAVGVMSEYFSGLCHATSANTPQLVPASDSKGMGDCSKAKVNAST